MNEDVNESPCISAEQGSDGRTLAETPYYILTEDNTGAIFSLRGDWNMQNIAQLEKLLSKRALESLQYDEFYFRCGGMQQFDLSGAWLLYSTGERLRTLGRKIHLAGFRDEHLKFIEDVLDIDVSRVIPVEPVPLILRVTEKTAVTIQELGRGISQRFAWWVLVTRTLVASAAKPSKLRWIATVRHIGDVGISAIGIVALMTFLVALVLGFQGQSQLTQFGA